MNSTKLQTALIQYAKSDMAKARKETEILITRTKVGFVQLTYNAGTKTYSAQSLKGFEIVDHFVNVKAKTAAAKLATLYDVRRGDA
jgi:hypothetical protein